MMNYFRAFRTLLNFAWTITDAANYKLTKTEFDYDIIGAEFLDQLGAARGAIVLTAHMGNYDLGAALFAQKFNRQIQIVRAPEPDAQTANHLNESLEQSGEGAVKIAYNSDGALLSLDLLNTLRAGRNCFHSRRSRDGRCRLRGRPALRSTGADPERAVLPGAGGAGRRFFRSSLCALAIIDIRSLSASRSLSRARRRRGTMTLPRRLPHGVRSWRKRSRNTGINGFRWCRFLTRMNNPERRDQPQYYFALPRLVASQLGWNAARTESNWLEANIVGGFEHLIWYAFAAHTLLPVCRRGNKSRCSFRLAFCVWICWLLVIYLNSVLIRLLRVCGLLRDLSNARAQSVLLGIVTTGFAFYLARTRPGWAFLESPGWRRFH